MYRIILKKVVLSLAILSFLFSSCSPNKDKEEQGEVAAFRNEVMQIHDEVMPSMGSLMNLQKQLKERISEIDSSQLQKKKALSLLVTDLEEADEAMMQWMRTYQEPSEEMSKEEALAYLEKKKQEIIEVKQKIEQSEKAAKAALAEI